MVFTSPVTRGREDDHPEEGAGAVFLLQDRTDQQDYGEVTHQVFPAGVTDNMAYQPKIGGGTGRIEIAPGQSGKKGEDNRRTGKGFHQQYRRCQQGKGQGDRGIVAYTHYFISTVTVSRS